MTKTRLTELTNEITRLQEIDRLTTEAVAAEFEAMEFINSGGNPLEIDVPCSAALDQDMANESI